MLSKFSIPKTIFKSQGNFTLKLFMESINAQTKKKKKIDGNKHNPNKL